MIAIAAANIHHLLLQNLYQIPREATTTFDVNAPKSWQVKGIAIPTNFTVHEPSIHSSFQAQTHTVRNLRTCNWLDWTGQFTFPWMTNQTDRHVADSSSAYPDDENALATATQWICTKYMLWPGLDGWLEGDCDGCYWIPSCLFRMDKGDRTPPRICPPFIIIYSKNCTLRPNPVPHN